MVALLSLVYGYVQWSLGHAPWAALGCPAALALMGFEYGAAFIGQGLGAEQMYTLRSLLDGALDAAEASKLQPPLDSAAEVSLARDLGL